MYAFLAMSESLTTWVSENIPKKKVTKFPFHFFPRTKLEKIKAKDSTAF